MSLSRGEAYAIVELPIGADPDSIRASYKRLALKWHPDKHRGINYNEALWYRYESVSRPFPDQQILVHPSPILDCQKALSFSQVLLLLEDFDASHDKFQQVSKAYKRLITDRDVTSMTPEEMYKLYQQTFHKPPQPDADGVSFELKNNGQILTEEEKERRRLEKRKAKKKQRREKKKMEKQGTGQKKDEGKQTKSSKSKDGLLDNGTKKNDSKADSVSASDSENFDSNSAFYSQVITKKKKSTVAAALNNNSDSHHHQHQMQQQQQLLQQSRGKPAEEKEPDVKLMQPQCDETWDQMDALILQSRQLAIQGNEMANCGQYVTAIDLFTKAIQLNPKDFRFLGNRSYCYDRILQYDKALKDAARAISLAPEWPKGYFRKGRALAGMKMYTEAEQAFIHVLKLDANCDDAMQELTRIRTQQITEMGFTGSEAEAALVQYPTLQQALDSLLTGLAGNGLSIRSSSGDATSTSHLVNNRHPPTTTPALHPLPQHQHYQQAAAPKVSHNSPGAPVDVKMDPANPEGLLALWVGNVLPEVSDKKLTQMFSKFGTVTSVRCLPDKFCAFINFKDKESAAKAMKNLQGIECAGQKLLIKFPDNPVTAGNVVIKKSSGSNTSTTGASSAGLSAITKKGSSASPSNSKTSFYAGPSASNDMCRL